MSTVTFFGVRLTDGNSPTGYSKLNSGGGSPSSEPQLAYRKPNVTNVKATSSGNHAGLDYTHGAQFNLGSLNYPLIFIKGTISDNGDLDAAYGAQVRLGSASGAYDEFNVAGSGANNDAYIDGYSSQGGLATNYLVTAINPTVADWREARVGSPNFTQFDYMSFGGRFVAGAAKTENLGFGPIDIGEGLAYSGSAFSFGDAADTDQDIDTNRWGLACRNGSVITLRGKQLLGHTGTALTGTDESDVLIPDGYHGTGDFGFECNTASGQAYGLAGNYTGLGRSYGTVDTRPSLSAEGDNTGSITITGNFRNWNVIALTPAHTVDGALLECADLVHGGASITDATIGCDAAAGVATCDDFTPGDATNVRWVQLGAGHAIEITSPGTYAFTGQFFEGFGADGTTSAAIYNNSGGAVTINVVGGGDTPTVRDGAGASTTVNNTISLTIDGLIAGGTLSIFDNEDADPQFLGTLLDSENPIAGASYVFTHSTPGNEVIVQMVASGYEELNQTVTLAAADQSLTLRPQLETNL